jgi:hypothetical protein
MELRKVIIFPAIFSITCGVVLSRYSPTASALTVVTEVVIATAIAIAVNKPPKVSVCIVLNFPSYRLIEMSMETLPVFTIAAAWLI